MNQEQRLNDLFERAKQLPTVHSFEQVKAQFVAGPVVSTPKKAKILTLKNFVIMFSLSTIALVAIWLASGSHESPVVKETQKTTQLLPVAQTKQKQENTPNAIPSTVQPQPSALLIIPTVLPTEQVIQTIANLPPLDEATESQVMELPRSKRIDEYQFPKLTEEEIAANHKRKKKMIKALEKHDNKVYAYVPSGSFNYDSKTVSVQAFYIGVGEVTNVEYRTFLFDLLISERKDEFLKAKPDQTQWVVMFKGGMQAFQDHYFSHTAYDDYPVVNVSREGAEMYCKWLTEEVNKVLAEKKRGYINDLRIPTRVEWVMAASNIGTQLPYPWDGQFIRNRDGSILANFTRPTEPDSTGGGRYVGEFDVLAPSKSYWPNARGLFNMAGNAAEMVVETGSEMRIFKSQEEGEKAMKDVVYDFGTAGGSWRNSAEEIKILAPDPNKGDVTPKPTIGFRVVTTYIGDLGR